MWLWSFLPGDGGSLGQSEHMCSQGVPSALAAFFWWQLAFGIDFAFEPVEECLTAGLCAGAAIVGAAPRYFSRDSPVDLLVRCGIRLLVLACGYHLPSALVTKRDRVIVSSRRCVWP